MASVYNHTSPNQSSVETNAWYLTVRNLQTTLLPGVCLAGFVGNLLAVGAFLSQDLRQTSCCLYLASKAISDICFLVSLTVVWLYRLDVPVFQTEGACQTVVFVTYISSFLSVWFVVLITWENFIRVSLPGHVARFCNVRRAKYTIFFLIMLSIGIYSFSLWTTGLISKNNDSNCLVLEKYETLLVAMTFVDSVLTLVIPLIIMVFLNIAIAASAIHARERQKRLHQNVSPTTNSRRRHSVIEMKVSKLLFAVSIIFILLHTPSHVIRIKMIVTQNMYMVEPSLGDVIMHRVFELFYYMNFSSHIGVYLIFGKRFRMVFKTLYCWRCNEHIEPQSSPFVTYCKRDSESQTMLE